MDNNMLKDCLHNFSKAENNNQDLSPKMRYYYRGMVIGLITGLMHTGMDYIQATSLIQESLPEDSLSLVSILHEDN